MGLLNQPRLARTAKQGLMSPLEIQMDTMVNDPLRPNLSSRLTQQDLINKGLLAIGMAPIGMAGKLKNTGLLGGNVKTLQEQLRNVESKYEPLRQRKLWEGNPEWDAVSKEAAGIRKQLFDLTGDWYGRPKVKSVKPADDLLYGQYNSPTEVPAQVKEWINKNANLLTSDATDAVRWGRISGTAKHERYANEPVTIYRALSDGDEIRPGDWVTTSKEYAEQHLSRYLKGKGKILEETVNGKDVLVSPTGNIEEAIFAPLKYSK